MVFKPNMGSVELIDAFPNKENWHDKFISTLDVSNDKMTMVTCIMLCNMISYLLPTYAREIIVAFSPPNLFSVGQSFHCWLSIDVGFNFKSRQQRSEIKIWPGHPNKDLKIRAQKQVLQEESSTSLLASFLFLDSVWVFSDSGDISTSIACPGQYASIRSLLQEYMHESVKN